MASEVLFTINKNDQVGRYAVASRALKPGDLIFSEQPFAYGPKSGRCIFDQVFQCVIEIICSHVIPGREVIRDVRLYYSTVK